MINVSIRILLVTLCVVNLGAEQYVVTLRSAAVPSALIAYRPVTLIDRLGDVRKRADQLQTVQQRAALDALSRYVIVELGNASALEQLRLIDGVLDVRPVERYRLHSARLEALTNDSLVGEQYALQLLGAASAWKTATGKGVIVGVLDTGIDWLHQDLIGSLAISGPEDVNGNGRFDDWPSDVVIEGVPGDLNGIDDDGNGVADDVIGYDFVDQSVRNLGDDRDRDPVPFDEQGHGTSVAGVIAATANNVRGIAGLAYNARLRALRAFDATGNAEEDDIASALIYAALTGVHVVNMSFGDGVDSPMFRDAVAFAAAMNVVLVASTGNSGSISRQYPAGYDNVIAVGSTNSDDRRSPFSSTGSLVSIAAPGEAIITTAVNSRYRRVNGTSFAAPYVAAAAAMLRERFPQITTDEIRSMLEVSSLDLGAPGWDPSFGAGRLRADVALAQAGFSILRITSPINEQIIDRRSRSMVDVRGTVVLLNQAEYHVEIGSGLDPQIWTHLVMSPNAVRNVLLADIALATLQDGLYTIRVRVIADDGRTFEQRRRVTITGGSDTIVSAELLSAWKSDRRAPVATFRTTQPSVAWVRMRSESGDSVVLSDVRRRVRLHSLSLPELAARDSAGAITIRCSSADTEAIDTTFAYRISTNAAPQRGWQTTQSVSWTGYVLNDVRDIYRDGSKTVVMTDLSENTFGGIRTLTYDGTLWRVRDSLPDTWIPRGISDVNGNGLFEVFCHVLGKAVLFEQATPGGTPFARVLFADTLNLRQGAAVADINGDGREELLMLSDSGCTVVTFRNGGFEELGRIPNTSEPAAGTRSNRVDEISIATGDFSGLGRTEIAFSDTDGDLVISAWDGANFTRPFVISADGAGGSGYVAAGDVDGDGRPEVIYGVPDSIQANADREYGRQVWTYRMVKGSSNGTERSYSVVWTEHFDGVRYGIGFRNGLAVGDLDRVPGAEIAICVYPRLYVFGQRSGTITPLWYQSDVVTPRMLIHDFNRNGVNELGVGTTVPMIGAMTGFRFSERDTITADAPSALRARRSTPTTVHLDWMPVASATAYIVEAATDGAPPVPIDTIADLETTHMPPASARTVRYVVRAVFASGLQGPSSVAVSVLLGAQVQVVSVTPDTIGRSALHAGVQLQLEFNDDLALQHLEPSGILLSDSAARRAVRASSITAGGTRRAVVTFPSFDVQQSCVVSVGGLVDATMLGIRDTSIRLAVRETPAPREEIIIASLGVLAPTSLLIEFTQDIDNSAENAANYALRPVGAVVDVVRRSSREVILQLDPALPLRPRGVPYSITATNITNTSGAVMTTGAGRTREFTVRADDLESAYVYPHPVKLQQDVMVTFAGVTASARVVVFDAMMRPIIELAARDRSGGIHWDLMRSTGERISPGLYFYRVTDDADAAEPVLRKLMIER